MTCGASCRVGLESKCSWPYGPRCWAQFPKCRCQEGIALSGIQIRNTVGSAMDNIERFSVFPKTVRDSEGSGRPAEAVRTRRQSRVVSPSPDRNSRPPKQQFLYSRNSGICCLFLIWRNLTCPICWIREMATYFAFTLNGIGGSNYSVNSSTRVMPPTALLLVGIVFPFVWSFSLRDWSCVFRHSISNYKFDTI